jgi:hypothetical protein
MDLIKENITFSRIQQMAVDRFGNLVKAVVDIERELIAIDAELHSDLEALLINDGSSQRNLWGINLYPEMQGKDFIEFDSLINLRPSQGNSSRGVEDEAARRKITEIIEKRITR